MTVSVIVPASSSFNAADLFDAIDYLTTSAQVGGFSPTLITGTGILDGEALSFSFVGTGFALGQINGDTYITSGILDSIHFTTASAGTVQLNNFDIDMSVFSQIVAADLSGAATTGIEDYMLAKEWNFRLGNADDVAPKGSFIGDNVAFNPMSNDIIRGMGGNDNLYSGDGNDKLFGNKGKDRLDGGDGNDVVKGGKGNDKLFGGAGHDKLFGEDGRDVLKGGGQKDVLDGGKGNDDLIGGAGADRFVFKDSYGSDRVLDFDANNNKEDIDLSGVTAIANFADLKANYMVEIDGNVIIDDQAGTEITLVGVDLADLGKADFIF